jgi:hypothetical protein
MAMFAWICACSLGCVNDTYQFGISRAALASRLPRTPNLITLGGHHPRIDSIERVIDFPGKKFREWFPSEDPDLLLDPTTRQLKVVQSASDYLDANGLKGVYIDVREYNPSEQWNRMLNNDRISPFWKYTGGSLYYLGYCALPGRALGWDNYNAFTNTLSINSESPSSSVFHAGYVKKIYDQKYPGTYIAMNWLPILPLIRDSSVSSDVLTYARTIENWELERGLYPQVYGRLGGDVVAQATSLIPGIAYMPFYTAPLLTGAGHVAGRVTGRTIAENRIATQRMNVVR